MIILRASNEGGTSALLGSQTAEYYPHEVPLSLL
jgi:hypothetical protein